MKVHFVVINHSPMLTAMSSRQGRPCPDIHMYLLNSFSRHFGPFIHVNSVLGYWKIRTFLKTPSSVKIFRNTTETDTFGNDVTHLSLANMNSGVCVIIVWSILVCTFVQNGCNIYI